MRSFVQQKVFDKKNEASVVEYRISSFKFRGVYLILGLLGATFIRGRRLFWKLK